MKKLALIQRLFFEWRLLYGYFIVDATNGSLGARCLHHTSQWCSLGLLLQFSCLQSCITRYYVSDMHICFTWISRRTLTELSFAFVCDVYSARRRDREPWSIKPWKNHRVLYWETSAFLKKNKLATAQKSYNIENGRSCYKSSSFAQIIFIE